MNVKQYLFVVAVTIATILATTEAQYGGGALVATALLGGLAAGALGGVLLARGGLGRSYVGYKRRQVLTLTC